MQFRRVPGRDSAQVVTPFVQVGTSSFSPVPRGTDYAFISSKSLENRFRRVPTSSAWVHPAGQSHDLGETGYVQMFATNHSSANTREEFEVVPLPRSQWVPPEVRDDASHEAGEASNLPLQRLVASIRPNGPAPKVPLHIDQDFAAIAVLADRNAGPHLKSHDKREPGCDRDREASLTVNISRDVRREIHEI